MAVAEEKQKIADKIRKMVSNEGRTEAEAQAFALKIQELLTKYKLEMSDIEFDLYSKTEKLKRYRVRWEEHKVRWRKRRVGWIERMGDHVARAYQCRLLVVTGSSTLFFLGRENDAAVAEYALVGLVKSAEKLADRAYVKYFYACRDQGDATLARGFRRSFLEGFVDRLGQRLKDYRNEILKQKQAIIRLNDAELDEALKDINSIPAAKLPKLNWVGVMRGVEAANKVKFEENSRDPSVNAKERP